MQYTVYNEIRILEDDIYGKIGDRVATLMKDAGMTQKELAISARVTEAT